MEGPGTAAPKKLGRRGVLIASASLVTARAAHAATGVIRVGYIRWLERRPTISFLDQKSPDDGVAGVKLAIDDDNTTGRLMEQAYELVDAPVRQDDDPVATLGTLVSQGITLVLTDTPADRVLALADAGRGQGVTVFNLAAPDDSLREADCRANLIHVAPTRSMLADAVAQYLVWKKWTRWLLAYGSHDEDRKLADAYRRSAKRYGARIVQEREYKDTGGARQTDSGLTQTQQQMPVFTQGAPDYDILIAADESELFAGYLPYRTWSARPVAGSAGLVPVSWDASSESWGGAQLQNRFIRLFRRRMTALDMQGWTAGRMIGEAATRTGSADAKTIMDYMKGPDFAVAAYKGQKLTLRDWDWQLRQPILLSDGRNTVSISPQPGFLHQVTELDTLGYDRPETQCKLK
jgi:ABC transporter substrate binding protein (PQQ-dependent alcohol dehydrogenase system)